MGEVFETFGLKWAPFLSQVIIVLIVYAILKKFAFAPVLAMLDQRRQRIALGEANLEKIRKDLAEAEERAQEILNVANGKAERLIADAQESAGLLGEKKKQEAIVEAGQIMEKAREAAKLEQERVTVQLKRDFGRLVVDTTAKVTGKVLTAEDQERINRETAGQVAL